MGLHWRRRVKNMGSKPNIGGKVVINDKSMGVSQLFGARDRTAPNVYAYVGRELCSPAPRARCYTLRFLNAQPSIQTEIAL